MKVLVTGTSGFIGGEIAKGILLNGMHDVFGQFRSSAHIISSHNVRPLQCDLTKEVYLDEEIDYIIHCAAIQDYKGMPVREYIDANLSMTENIAKFGKKRGVKGLIFTSSTELHGQIKNDVIDENTDRINPSVYGLSKYISELVFQEYQEYFPTIALRLCGVAGPGAKNNWLAKVLAKAKCGENIGIVNAERPFNNLVHIDDLLNFMLMLLDNGFAGFNAFPLASKTPLSVINVVSEIIQSTHSTSAIVDNGLTNNSFTISNDFAISKFGYSPSDVITNLKKMAGESL